MGVGLTVMVKVCVPGEVGHPFAVAVRVYVTVMAEPVLLTAVNGATLPFPVLAPPMVLLSLVQLYIVFETLLEKVTVVVVPPLHTCWLEGTTTTTGLGLSAMMNDCGVPEQPPL